MWNIKILNAHNSIKNYDIVKNLRDNAVNVLTYYRQVSQ